MSEELAWAAGVFEATGSITSKHPRLNVRQKVTETGGPPDMILRFHRAIGGIGVIRGPYGSGGIGSKGLAMWYASRLTEATAVIELLWPWLGPDRRAQWERSIAPLQGSDAE